MAELTGQSVENARLTKVLWNDQNVKGPNASKWLIPTMSSSLYPGDLRVKGSRHPTYKARVYSTSIFRHSTSGFPINEDYRTSKTSIVVNKDTMSQVVVSKADFIVSSCPMLQNVPWQ